MLVLRLALVCATPAWAEEATGLRVGAYELGLQAGYSFGITKNAQMVTFFPRVTRILAIRHGTLPGALGFGIEGMFSRIFETNHAMELGGGLLLRYRLALEPVRPYAELGGAMLYSDLKNFDLDARVLFAAQGAVGVEVPITERLAATAGYRFRHISNAGQSRINPGLNSNLLMVGVSFVY
jgi:hypothetical protein